VIFNRQSNIYDLIDSATCAEIKLFGEDESSERISTILSNDRITAEERAKLLLRL